MNPVVVSTVYQRMVSDLVNNQPHFNYDGDDLYWADYDGSTYRVNLMKDES